MPDNRDNWLPTSRHAKDLIEHAEEHLKLGYERDLKFSLIHADNAIESLMKEHARYGRTDSLGEKEIVEMKFFNLLQKCEDLPVVQEQESHIKMTHDMRNAVYHFGIMNPSKEDVEYAVGVAKLLFNSMHPDHSFGAIQSQLPSEDALMAVEQALPSQVHRGIAAERLFADFLTARGYTVLARVGGADLVARAQNKTTLVLEIKNVSTKSYTDIRALDYFKQVMAMWRDKNPGKAASAIFVTNGSLAARLKKFATRYRIKFIDNFDTSMLGEILRSEEAEIDSSGLGKAV